VWQHGGGMMWHYQVCWYQVMVDCSQVGSTALMWASDCGHTDIVRQLLAAPGININAVNKVIALKDYWCSPLVMHGRVLGY
jgi:Ankyrin repeat